MRIIAGVDQLRFNPNLVGGTLDAAFDHMRDT
jgi:hypothetical protein